VIKRGWEHFDNAVICCLRLLEKLQVKYVLLAGFDGFKNVYNESYADTALPSLNPENKWDELNDEIKKIFTDFKKTNKNMSITFVTESLFNESI
jgi:4-hydroxy 2-oxovalerate aldolase